MNARDSKTKGVVFILVTILMAICGTQSIGYAQEGTPTITASVEEPLTEAILHESFVTLTLTGWQFVDGTRAIGNAVSVSGIDGVTVYRYNVYRVSDTTGEGISDTEVEVRLTFSGNMDTDAILTFTVGASAIVGYDGQALTAQVSVTAMEESLEASTEAPLTEANLHGNIITLMLTGRRFVDSNWAIADAVAISGVDGITFEPWDVDKISDTEVTVELTFSGNIDEDATLSLTLGSDAIVGGGYAFTIEFPVPAVEESLDISTEFHLTEATLDGSVIALTLAGRQFVDGNWAIADALSVSGIDGVTVEPWYVNNISGTEVRVRLTFSGNMDADATLTFAVGADAIAGYNQEFTAQFSVTAIQKSNAVVSISPASVQSPAVGEQFTLNLNIAGGENVAGYQVTVLYDDSALNLVDAANGGYLPANPFFLADRYYGYVRLNASTLALAANGDGTLAALTFQTVDFKASTVALSDVYLVDADGIRWEATTIDAEVTIPPEPPEPIFGDVNRDGVVDIQDLKIVNARFGQTGQNSADLNEDGLVDIIDLVLVAGAVGDEAAAPKLFPQALELITTTDIQDWLTEARQLTLTDPVYLRGITTLEQLLKTLTPKKTALLPNYPNPFNPETWIPYHLSNDADVQISIYDMKGVLVRRLDIGHQTAGYYTDRTKAANWDGKNEFGEDVASAVYFYHLSTRKYSAARKMLILK